VPNPIEIKKNKNNLNIFFHLLHILCWYTKLNQNPSKIDFQFPTMLYNIITHDNPKPPCPAGFAKKG
jgi:hypothetical protein